MTLHDRLHAIVDAMPDSASVTLPISELRQWLEEDNNPSGDHDSGGLTDLTCEQIAEQLGRTPACVRGWCRTGRLEGAYRLRGREWRVPRSALRAFLQAQATKEREPRPNRQTQGVDLAAWRREGRKSA